MNPKQLANVFVKILGLSVCIHTILGIINGVSMMIQIASMSQYGSNWQAIFYLLGPFITFGFGRCSSFAAIGWWKSCSPVNRKELLPLRRAS